MYCVVCLSLCLYVCVLLSVYACNYNNACVRMCMQENVQTTTTPTSTTHSTSLFEMSNIETRRQRTTHTDIYVKLKCHSFVYRRRVDFCECVCCIVMLSHTQKQICDTHFFTSRAGNYEQSKEKEEESNDLTTEKEIELFICFENKMQ